MRGVDGRAITSKVFSIQLSHVTMDDGSLPLSTVPQTFIDYISKVELSAVSNWVRNGSVFPIVNSSNHSADTLGLRH